MVFGFRRSRSRAAYDDEYADDPWYGDMRPGDRIGGPVARRHRNVVARGFVLLSLIAAGWAVWKDPAWLDWSYAQASAFARVVDERMRAPSEPTAAARVPANRPRAVAAPPPPPATLSAAVIPSPAAKFEERVPEATRAPPPEAETTDGDKDGDKDEGWQPPRADPADPLQVRAEAVGLHPNLSRAVLARLSEEDYRNAGIAIKTAVAETPDDGVFVWPRQRKPELAHFQVRFVPGAAPSCRRYVVIVTKDRWSTTALPMERCGVQPRQAQRS